MLSGNQFSELVLKKYENLLGIRVDLYMTPSLHTHNICISALGHSHILLFYALPHAIDNEQLSYP